MTFPDSLTASLAMFGQLRNAENVFLQFREGVIDESVLSTYAYADKRYLTSSFAAYWERVALSFDTAFVRAFEEANGLR